MIASVCAKLLFDLFVDRRFGTEPGEKRALAACSDVVLVDEFDVVGAESVEESEDFLVGHARSRFDHYVDDLVRTTNPRGLLEDHVLINQCLSPIAAGHPTIMSLAVCRL
jgi:hypothetical protein